MTNRQQGFTLIELLVVIAIIGILSSVVLASLNSAREKSRDARRISDVKQLQLALELYFDSNSEYPQASSSLAGDYIAALPLDPLDNATYNYTYTASPSSAATDYVVRAVLEDTSHNALSGDIDGTVFTVDCADASGYYCVQP